jgi:choline-sulfatase
MNSNRPNIIVILSDDQGPWAMGCAGNDEIRTPNLDRLAAEGTRLDRFFCASPVCSPARASLLTGQIPSQHGVHDWISAGNIRTPEQEPIQYLAGKPSYTQVLAGNGYTCGLSGKWHLGDSIVPQHGFSHWYVHQQGGGPYYDAPMIRNGELTNEPGYLTDNITDDALAFIDREHEQSSPFYLSVHYTAPHSPWIDSHPQEYVDLYADCRWETIPRDPVHPWAVPGWTPEPESDLWREQLKGYFAAVTAMDANIGRLLDRLDALGLRENTMLLRASRHLGQGQRDLPAQHVRQLRARPRHLQPPRDHPNRRRPLGHGQRLRLRPHIARSGRPGASERPRARRPAFLAPAGRGRESGIEPRSCGDL